MCVCMYVIAFLYVYICIYLCMDVSMCLCMHVCIFMYVCMYVSMYGGMHQFCSVTTNLREFVPKYLCSFNTELHITTNWASTDTYRSSCSVPTCYTNVN